MRVNLSYSVDLDDVPKEVSRLLTEAQKKQESIFLLYSKIIQAINAGDAGAPLAAIDQIRLAMAKLDVNLQDVSNILTGFNHASAPEEFPESPPELEESEEENAE